MRNKVFFVANFIHFSDCRGSVSKVKKKKKCLPPNWTPRKPLKLMKLATKNTLLRTVVLQALINDEKNYMYAVVFEINFL